MGLKEKISDDLKDALKSGDKIRLQTIRSIRALILEFEKSGANKKMDEPEEIKLLTSSAKKRKESIEQFRNAGREDLAVKEEEELKIIMSYLPEQLTEKEIEIKVTVVAKNIDATTREDFPMLMGEMMKQLKGKADGKVVRAIVEKVLGEN